MKKLSDILYKAGLVEVIGSTDVPISSICFDSRKVEKNSLFVAVKGIQTDGHKFISQAISSGAIAIVCEKFPDDLKENVSYIKVNNSNEALGIIASNFFDNPSEKLSLVGVTGTNGKTTVATLLYKLFLSLGLNSGLISTVTYKINNEERAATHTTPDAIQLNQLLREMVNAGCTYCFMEVSSHAIVQRRIAGLKFSGAIFTNITHDHLDYHKTFDEYLKAKKKLFDDLDENAFALVNKDDRNAMLMLQNTKALKKTYALKSTADFKGKIIESHLSGLFMNIDGKEMWSKLIGSFNAYNLLAVYAAAVLLSPDINDDENKIVKQKILTVLSSLGPVDGRFQQIKAHNGVLGIVDYAHTPDALLNVLKTIRQLMEGDRKIVTVVGCGGDRDELKRPIMARIACEESDKVILTSDNPRNENPDEIIRQMQKGIERKEQKKVITITDRREAIRTACMLASAGDVILVAGKGHEKYQEIKGVKYPFDDVKELKECLNQ
jgi:UDP-N-acetylmuramoyl-L-alanyl-D-glutamate--2,6-diaminopimelate ligase